MELEPEEHLGEIHPLITTFERFKWVSKVTRQNKNVQHLTFSAYDVRCFFNTPIEDP